MFVSFHRVQTTRPGALCAGQVSVGFIYYNENNVIKIAVLVFLILSYAKNINGYLESKEISLNIIIVMITLITIIVIKVHQW